MKNNKPTIIEVFLNKNDTLKPKVSSIIRKNGQMISMPLEDMSPLISITKLKNILDGKLNKNSKTEGSKMKKITFVIATYNEEENVENLVNELNDKVISKKSYSFEILFIDNDSKDNTASILKIASQIRV